MQFYSVLLSSLIGIYNNTVLVPVLVLDFDCVPYSWYIRTWPIINI